METTHSNSSKFLVLMLLIAACAAGLMLYSDHPVIFHSHALTEHGEIAHKVRTCLLQGNLTMIYKFNPKAQVYLCQMDDGRWAMQFTCRDAKYCDLWHELTSFIKGHGTWDETIKYLARVAGKTVPEVLELLLK